MLNPFVAGKGQKYADCGTVRKRISGAWHIMWEGREYGGDELRLIYQIVWPVENKVPLEKSDFERIKTDLGARFSCQEVADIINSSDNAKRCCVKVLCAAGFDTMDGEQYVARPKKSIHESLR